MHKMRDQFESSSIWLIWVQEKAKQTEMIINNEYKKISQHLSATHF